MDVRQVGRSMGAEVTGVDLRRLDDATFDRIREAFLAHQVLVVRDQAVTPEVQIAFSRRFGPRIQFSPQLLNCLLRLF